MKLSKQQLSDIIYTPVIKDELDRLASEARAELEAGTLEIEGYERSEWTCFDPNDPKTFPPEYVSLLYTYKGKTFVGDSEDVSRDYLFNDRHTYWRPMPNPPQEEYK